MNQKSVLGCVFETPMCKYYYDTNRNAILCISDNVYDFLKKKYARRHYAIG